MTKACLCLAFDRLVDGTGAKQVGQPDPCCSRCQGAGSFTVLTAADVRAKLERIAGNLIVDYLELRDLFQHLSTPGVTTELPEANSQLMLTVRALEDADHRIRRTMDLICACDAEKDRHEVGCRLRG